MTEEDWPDDIKNWVEAQPPPKPDPFEEWWWKGRETHFQIMPLERDARIIWDAAIKWKEGQK